MSFSKKRSPLSFLEQSPGITHQVEVVPAVVLADLLHGGRDVGELAAELLHGEEDVAVRARAGGWSWRVVASDNLALAHSVI